MGRPHPLIVQLADERRQLDLTVTAVAEIAGLSRDGLYDLEAGRGIPALTTLELLAHALGYTVALVHIGERQCRACKETKPIRLFGRDPDGPDGISTHCGACEVRTPEQKRHMEPARRRAGAILAEGRQTSTANANRAAQRDTRLAQYAGLLADGLTDVQAAEALNLQPWTRRRYNRLLEGAAA